MHQSGEECLGKVNRPAWTGKNTGVGCHALLQGHTIYNYMYLGTYQVAQTVKNLPAMQETWVQSLCQEDTLEKEMAYICI